jgi:hypothetical protein
MSKQVPDSLELIDEVLAVSENLVDTSVKTVGGYAVPEGTKRVKVRDEKGKLAWRKIEEFKSTDTVDLGPKGFPQWMGGELGRPKSSSGQPSLHEQMPPSSEALATMLKIKEAGIRTDPIVLAAEATPEAATVLDQVMLGIAEEAASLRFERQDAERTGRDSSPLSMRRVVALKAIGDTYLKRKEIVQNQLIDLDGKPFQALFGLISETFTKAMLDAGVREELVDSVFAKFRNALDDEWRNEARNRMTGEEE